MRNKAISTSYAVRRYLWKGLILLSVGYAMVQVAHWALGFTFFTQLSNLYVAAVVIAQLFDARRGRETRGIRVAKMSAVVSITVTFAVFLTVLAPLVPGGLLAAYGQDHCASLCMHMITPTCALIDFFVNDADYPWRKCHALWSAAPPLGYFAAIVAMGRCGFRWGRGTMMAPYPFIDYGNVGWFTFAPAQGRVGVAYVAAAMLLAFFLLSWLLMAAAKRVAGRRG